MKLPSVGSQPILNLPSRIIETDGQDFRSQFNRIPFQFSHNLAGHSLFEIPRLVELADTIALKSDPRKVVCLASKISADRKWSDMTRREQVIEAITHIEESGSLVLIKSAHLDPDYKVLMDQILAELEELTGVPLHREITWPETYIFISSPNSVTPYHIDHEPNFLFQIRGQKEVNLFDPFDRSILTEQEIEEYFAFNLEAATYQEENQSKAYVFPLIPGKVVHHPSLAPHWVRNGNNVSVSLSINFCMRSVDLNARVYQVNHFLRKLGINPTPCGRSLIKDQAKIAAMSIFAKRNPKIKDDVVFSGVLRFKETIRRLAKLTGK
jgi:hypothetical protein